MTLRNFTIRTTAAALTALIAITGQAAANDADNAIKFRKKVMGAVGSSAGNIAAVLKGEAGSPDHLATLTQILVLASDPALTKAAFEPNTHDQGSEKTTANAKIWSDWAKFSKGLDDMNAAAKAAAAKGADVTFAEMKPVFGTCKACHDNFRDK